MPTESPKHPRTARACVNCNKKKIRCRFDEGQETCGSCVSLNIACIARTRKKRKVTAPQTSPNELIINQHATTQNVPYPYWDTVTSAWATPNQQIEIQGSAPSSNLVQNGPSVPNPDSGYSNGANHRYSIPNLHQESNQAASSLSPESSRYNESKLQIPSGSEITYGSTPAQNQETEVYVGRNHYIAHDVPIDETSAGAYQTSKKDELSETEMKVLELWGSFEIPSRAARQSLIDTYMQKCYPWTPILNPQDLENRGEKPASLLLNQAVFLAASKVSSAPGITAFASSEQFYQRAKALFWVGHEKNPLTVITATTMLHWYNPDGPEHVSYDTSTFWLQIAAGLAHQVGLHKEPTRGSDQLARRRLWWTLVARDCLIASGQGRPRAINLKDSDVRPPCLEDFPGAPDQGQLFISYVEICTLLGDLTECYSRKHMSQSRRLHMERALYRWTRTLPVELRLCHKIPGSEIYALSQRNAKGRQIHVPYFITLTIMSRTSSAASTPSPVAILASSFVAGIFEEFLARDELSALGSIFTFYLLAAGVALASVRRYPSLSLPVQQDLSVLQNSLQELSKRWPSAIGAKNALQNVIDATPSDTNGLGLSQLTWLSAEQQLLFEGFAPELCRLWPYYRNETRATNTPIVNGVHTNESTELMTAEILENLRYPLAARQERIQTPIMNFNPPEADNPLANYQYDGIGNWLLNDWGPDVLW